jgi:hypothetical protein
VVIRSRPRPASPVSAAKKYVRSCGSASPIRAPLANSVSIEAFTITGIWSGDERTTDRRRCRRVEDRQVTPAKMVPLNQIHRLVTDSSADPGQLERIASSGVRVRVVNVSAE